MKDQIPAEESTQKHEKSAGKYPPLPGAVVSSLARLCVCDVYSYAYLCNLGSRLGSIARQGVHSLPPGAFRLPAHWPR